MKIKSIVIALLTMLVFFPAHAGAAAVGKLTSVEGKADITSPGKEAKPAHIGDAVNVSDILRTKSKSKCEVTFGDGNILRLAENTRLKITEYMFDKGPRNEVLNLFRGKIQNIVQKVTNTAGPEKAGRYEIHTPTAVCGVRGTNFFAYHQSGVSGAIFKEGIGYGYSINRPQDVRTINPGQAMVITNPNRPPTIRPATPLELDKHLKDTAPAEKKASGDNSGNGNSDGSSGGAPSGTPGSSGGSSADNSGASNGGSSGFGAGEGDSSGPTLGGLPPDPPVLTVVTPITTPPPVIVNQPQVTRDTVPPTITEVTGPAALNNQRTVTIGVKTDEITTISYRLDGGDWVDATGQGTAFSITINNLPEKAHAIEFKATDTAKNSSMPSSYTWTTDLTPPEVTLTAKPAALTSSSAATFTFSTETGATYSYTTDGVNYTPVTNGTISLTNLSEGQHTVNIKATDAAGNSFTIPSTWTTDYTAPAITLSGTPAPVTDSPSADFGVTTNEQATYSYTLNGKPVSSPTFTDLPEGSNTFTVEATDAAGNKSTKTYTWTTEYIKDKTLSGAMAAEKSPFGGTFSGNLTGTINHDTGATTINVEGTSSNPGPLPSGAVVSGTISDGRAFSGFALGNPESSWRGLLRTIYVTGNGAGFFYGTASGTSSGDSGLNTFSGTGTATFGPLIGNTSLAPADLATAMSRTDWSITLPQFGSVAVATDTSLSFSGVDDSQAQLRGITLDGGKRIGVWGVTTNGGSYANSSGSSSLSGNFGSSRRDYYPISTGDYLMFGPVSGADTGKVTLTGTLDYLDPDYLGKLKFDYYGYTDGTGNYRSIMAGDAELEPLAFLGYADYACRYQTPPGYSYLEHIGDLWDVTLGGARSLWYDAASATTGVPFLAMGTYDHNPYPYFDNTGNNIWYSYNLSSYNYRDDTYTTYDGGAYQGFMAGIETASGNHRALEGRLVAIYIDPDGKAGFLKGSAAGTAGTDTGMFKMSGSIIREQMTTDSGGVSAADLRGNIDEASSSEANGFSVSGLVGTFDGSATPGITTDSSGHGETAYIADWVNYTSLNWGIYGFKMNGTLGSPTAGAWKGKVGGDGSFGASSADRGYWLADINDGTAADGKLTGLLSGRFITADMMGDASATDGALSGTGIKGDFLGTYNADDTWQAVGIGTWRGTPLAWSGTVDYDYNDGGLYTVDDYYGVNAEGDTEGGLAGGIMAPWSGTQTLSYMGEYYYNDGIGQGPYLWTAPVYSYDYRFRTNTTYDGGAFFGLTSGIWLADTDKTIDARINALYVSPSGSAGILKGTLAGNYYPELNMYQTDGTWTPVELEAGSRPVSDVTGIDIGNPHSHLALDYYSAGIDVQGSFGGTDSAIDLLNSELGTSYEARSYSLPDHKWALWQAVTGGDYTGTPSDTWYLSTSYNDRYTYYDGSHIDATLVTGTETIGSLWSANKLRGDTYAFAADISAAAPFTWIGTGETLGTFDSTAATWQAVQGGAYLNTPFFLDLAATDAGRAKLQQLNIPAIEVGRTNLSGTYSSSGNTLNVYLNNLIFFAASAGGTPRLWATEQVSGDYNNFSFDYDQTVVPLSGGGLKADFTIKAWNTNKWLAVLDAGRGILNGSSTSFRGGAAGEFGSYNSLTGKYELSGTAAGITLPFTTFVDVTSTTPGSFAAGGTISLADDLFSKFSGTPGSKFADWTADLGGTYSGSTSDTWHLSTDQTSGSGDNTLVSGTETIGSKWSLDMNYYPSRMDYILTGESMGFAADTRGQPSTWVGAGTVNGSFNPADLTWQALQTTGNYVDTSHFFTLLQTDAGRAKLQDEWHIPAIEVGKATLSQGAGTVNNLSGVTMKDVTFFAKSTGGAPRIWASNAVSGNYNQATAPVAGGAAVPLSSGNGLSASFNVVNWNATNGKWLSTVTNGQGSISGTSVTNVNFRGAAAGTMGGGTLTGTAAGVVK